MNKYEVAKEVRLTVGTGNLSAKTLRYTKAKKILQVPVIFSILFMNIPCLGNRKDFSFDSLKYIS